MILIPILKWSSFGARLAEGDKGLIGIVQNGPAGIDPEIAPFLFEEIHVITTGDDFGIVVGLGIEARIDNIHGLFRFGIAVAKDHLFAIQ